MVEGLANKLKDLRRQNGYSQKQVADKLMVSPSIISGYRILVQSLKEKQGCPGNSN